MLFRSAADLVLQGLDTSTVTVDLTRSAATDEQQPNAMVLDAVDRQRTIDSMAEARRWAEQGNYEAARATVHAAYRLTAVNHSEAAAGYLADMDEGLLNLSSAGIYQARGAHQMASAVQSHSAQRSNRVWSDDATRSPYATPTKMRMRSKPDSTADP